MSPLCLSNTAFMSIVVEKLTPSRSQFHVKSEERMNVVPKAKRPEKESGDKSPHSKVHFVEDWLRAAKTVGEELDSVWSVTIVAMLWLTVFNATDSTKNVATQDKHGMHCHSLHNRSVQRGPPLPHIGM